MENNNENKNDIIENDIIDNDNSIYELVFNIVSKINQCDKENDKKTKIIRIITKIIENILNTEINGENSEKFRKIKVTNPNISLMLEIKGNLEFMKYLGFEEQILEDNKYLYLPQKNLNIPLLQKISSYFELILLDNDGGGYEQNYYSQNAQEENLTEAEKILRETGKMRFNRALQYNAPQNLNFNKNNDSNSNIHTLNDLKQNAYKDLTKIDKDKKCLDEIGKKCLQLTNNFRAKNKLPPLIWDDDIWRIALTHSKNMGEKKVPFSHEGFDERINLFPFYFSMACENVFTGFGYREYAVATAAVNGWISSPGHKKNLLSDTTHCAIATYRTRRGEYYLTQMFARK